MTLFVAFVVPLIIQLSASPIDILRKNVSCSDIKTPDGFEFKYNRPAGAEINVSHNKTKIGSLEIGKQPTHTTEVILLNNNAVITKTCRDLQIQFVTINGLVRESWVYFFVNKNNSVPDLVTPGSHMDPSQFNQLNSTRPVAPESHGDNRKSSESVGAIVAVGVLGAVGVFVGAVLLCYYMFWRQKMKSQQTATCSEYFRYLKTRCAINKQISTTTAESSGTRETRASEIKEAPAATEFQQNGISLDEIASATDPCSSGENGVEQDRPHGSVHVSVPPRSNGLDLKEIQSTSNGDLNTPDLDRAPHHGDRNSVRNMRDDPGGHKGYVGVDIPDDDMTAEVEPLVNKSDYGQDQVGGSFATPGTDVESPRVKRFGNY